MLYLGGVIGVLGQKGYDKANKINGGINVELTINPSK